MAMGWLRFENAAGWTARSIIRLAVGTVNKRTTIDDQFGARQTETSGDALTLRSWRKWPVKISPSGSAVLPERAGAPGAACIGRLRPGRGSRRPHDAQTELRTLSTRAPRCRRTLRADFRRQDGVESG